MSKEVNQGYQVELFQRVSKAFDVESETNKQNISIAADLIKLGHYPILVSNHQSHVDGIPHAFIVKKLIQQSQGGISRFYLPIAASIESGHQGNDLKELIISQKSILANFGLDLIAVTRKKDNEDFGIPFNNENVKKIIRSPQDNHGFVFFPEGTVKGGRTNSETGKIHGISKPDSLGALDPVIRGCIKNNKPFFFLPVGIDGSYKIVSPDHSKNGNQIDEFKMEKIMNFINVQNKAIISIGSPICSLEYESFPDKADGLMSAVAKLVTPDAQGVYARENRVNLD